MAEHRPQTFENHGRIVPAYHYVAFPIFVVNLVWAAYVLVRTPSVGAAIGLLLAIGLLILFFLTRLFVLTVQDRVIRLEMRLRLERLLPKERHASIDQLSLDQAVALRFASDEELPALVSTVLDENLGDRRQIKKLIKTWIPDYLRA